MTNEHDEWQSATAEASESTARQDITSLPLLSAFCILRWDLKFDKGILHG